MEKEKETSQSGLAASLMEYLGCPCRYFPPMEDDGPIMEAYQEAAERGKREGFIPVLAEVGETLWESLVANSHGNQAGAFSGTYEFSPQQVSGYRENMISALLQPGRELLEEYIDRWEEEAEEMGWEEEAPEDLPDESGNDCFSGYWDFAGKATYPLVLAEIPVKEPWKIFVWLPFGGWNECPDTLDLMAIAKYWFEAYGAVPAVITSDVLEFAVPQPVSQEQSGELASQHNAFCPDIVSQGMESVGRLANLLAKSTVWYFWWD